MAVINFLCIFLAVICSTYVATTDVGEPLFLTDYINSKQFDEAKRLATVNNDAMNAIALSFSGYLTVNEQTNSNLFFWYFPAAVEPSNAPVVLWLQGGPGASSLLGLFYENGPFVINVDQTLSPREFSWHIKHHLIFIDSPVGTGYSFASDNGYAENEVDVGADLYEALRQFFILFSNLQSNKFYVAGESYAGKYVPAISYTILQRNKIPGTLPKINLAGLAIGDGLTDPVHQLKYGDYLYELGFIDGNGHALITAYEASAIACIHKKDFLCAFRFFDELILTAEFQYGSVFQNLTGLTSYYNYVDQNTGSQALVEAITAFIVSPSTREAIHVGNKAFHELDDVNTVEQKLRADIMDSVADWVSELLSHYQVLIYNGQFDIIQGYPLTENYLRQLKFNGDADYKFAKRMIWRDGDDVAGYIKRAGNLTEVMVSNCGHMVPAEQPKRMLDLLMNMTYGLILDEQ